MNNVLPCRIALQHDILSFVALQYDNVILISYSRSYLTNIVSAARERIGGSFTLTCEKIAPTIKITKPKLPTAAKDIGISVIPNLFTAMYISG
jgi:hypothetical protein